MKTTFLFISIIVLLSILSGCKTDYPETVVAGTYYNDCFNKTPMSNRKLKLVWNDGNGYNGTIAETTTDEFGRFKFLFEDKAKYYEWKMEDVAASTYGDIFTDNLKQRSDLKDLTIAYDERGKVLYKIDFDSAYTNRDTLYYTRLFSSVTKYILGPFSPNMIIDSNYVDTSDDINKVVIYGIGKKDFGQSFYQGGCNSNNCTIAGKISCGETTIVTMKKIIIK